MIPVFCSSLCILLLNLQVGRNCLVAFFGSFPNSYLFSLWSKWSFLVINVKFAWSNPSSICFSLNHFIPLNTITSTLFSPSLFSDVKHFEHAKTFFNSLLFLYFLWYCYCLHLIHHYFFIILISSFIISYFCSLTIVSNSSWSFSWSINA